GFVGDLADERPIEAQDVEVVPDQSVRTDQAARVRTRGRTLGFERRATWSTAGQQAHGRGRHSMILRDTHRPADLRIRWWEARRDIPDTEEVGGSNPRAPTSSPEATLTSHPPVRGCTPSLVWRRAAGLGERGCGRMFRKILARCSDAYEQNRGNR